MQPNFVDKTIWTGDNLDILRGMNSESVDLIYLDPPFNSNRNYSAPVGSSAAGAAFKDTWTLSDLDVAWMGMIADEQPALYRMLESSGLTHGKSMQSYLCMMAVRLLEMRRVLKVSGSLYLHCDSTANHYLKQLLDVVFGVDNFGNEIVWERARAKGLASTRFARNHDVILRVTKSDKAVWNPIYAVHDSEYVRKFYRHKDKDGRSYGLDNLVNPNKDRPNLTYEFLGVTRVWRWTRERMRKTYEEGFGGLVIQTRPGAVPRFKRYLDEQKGTPVGDVWADIRALQGPSNSKEYNGYPTQKPLALLERIIKASSNEGDIVLDPFDCLCFLGFFNRPRSYGLDNLVNPNKGKWTVRATYRRLRTTFRRPCASLEEWARLGRRSLVNGRQWPLGREKEPDMSAADMNNEWRGAD